MYQQARNDKWLKVARIFKTRSKASDACEQGKVKVNDQVAKSAKTIKIGDVIAVKTKWKTRTFDVLDISHKSIAAAQARLLYHEHPPTPEEVEAEELRSMLYKSGKSFRPKYKGRPTKKEGRAIRRLKGY
jgi:ribosome-associated heat shock protein Hsp15